MDKPRLAQVIFSQANLNAVTNVLTGLDSGDKWYYATVTATSEENGTFTVISSSFSKPVTLSYLNHPAVIHYSVLASVGRTILLCKETANIEALIKAGTY